MNAKIDENGLLQIKRKGIFKQQLCPYSNSNNLIPCGDWCPRFDDDFAFDHLLICGKEMDIIVDKRKYKEKTE